MSTVKLKIKLTVISRIYDRKWKKNVRLKLVEPMSHCGHFYNIFYAVILLIIFILQIAKRDLLLTPKFMYMIGREIVCNIFVISIQHLN